MNEPLSEIDHSDTMCKRCDTPIIDLDCVWLPASNRRCWVHEKCTRESIEMAASVAEIFGEWQARAKATFDVFLHDATLDDRACLKAELRTSNGTAIEAAHLDLAAVIRNRDKLYVEIHGPTRQIIEELHLRLITRGTWQSLHDLAHPPHEPRDIAEAEAQVHENYQAFKERYEEALIAEHKGRFCLLHDHEVIKIHDSHVAAYQQGCADYGLGRFSVQEIGAKPVRMPTSVQYRQPHST